MANRVKKRRKIYDQLVPKKGNHKLYQKREGTKDPMKTYGSGEETNASRRENFWVGREVRGLTESYKTSPDPGFSRSTMGSKQHIKYKKGTVKKANRLVRT